MSIDTDIQSWPEVPSIAHFCSLFRQAFDLLEFEIQELEESLLLMGTPDDELRLVHQLMVKLLIGCLPMYKKNIKEENYSMYLRQFLQTKQEEAEEDGIEYRFTNPFQEDEVLDFTELDLREKVRVLHQLCEVRLEAADVADKVKKLEAASLRVDPLGTDSEGTTFWYFYGTRLYQEVPAQASARSPSKSKDRKKKRKEKKEKKRKRKHSEDLSDEESDGGDSVWSLACLTEDDWIELTEKYKKSRKKEDRNLYHTLNDAFLPEITTMFAEKEREEKQRLLMCAPKRGSTRIAKLKKSQEEKDRALALFLEEENRLELMGKSRRTRYTDDDADNSADIEKEREERAKQREMMKEMRAKRAAERLIQTEFSDDVSKQRELMRSKQNEVMPKKEEITDDIKISPKKDDDIKKRKSSLSSKKETSPLEKGHEVSRLSRKRKDSFESSSPSEDDISTRDNSDIDDDVSYRPPTKSQNARSTFTNALIKAGTKSTKDSTLEKPVRKTPGQLLQTAGKGLLNKVANKRLSAFDALLNSGPGPSASQGISFGLYGGYLPIDPGTSSSNLGSVFDEKIYSQENSGKNEEPTRKVFSNWGGEFFKKNLDFRTNTNKILEKMQLGKPGFGEVANGATKPNPGGTRLS